MITKETRRQKRKLKIRSKIHGTESRPRLTVYRTNMHIYAQLVDDKTAKTLINASDLKIKKGTKSEKAKEVGKNLSELAKSKKISQVVFDRSGYKFHGRIKELAEGAREAGLIF